MTSPLCVATGGWCRRVFHYRPPTPMYRNSPPLCTIVLQIPSLMPLKMRKVQLAAKRDLDLPRRLRKLDNFDFLLLDDLGYLPQVTES